MRGDMDTQRIPVNIEDEMKNSYLDYAMSVIIGRALPNVRDGLKPVHRRILYAMHELGLVWNKPFKKSARIVGEVLGKFHPHGDTAVYDAIVRMVQDFSLRYPLIAGQGNFGSVDGDSPAAMRYTEVKLAHITEEILADIEKETVDFVPNFDESLQEPVIMPAVLPNLLLNGSSGIAVGMATNIPPHNLGEVVDGVVKVIENPQIEVEELLKIIKGPDFPTGGFIYGTKGIRDAYTTGRGLLRLRAKVEIEETKDREIIIVKELPYQVNKARLIEKIADLVKNKKIEGISDLRDESDREGMRIVIELKRNEMSQIILNQLYKHTAMQTTFGVIMLALVDNQPRVLHLKEIIIHYINHRKEVIVRRTRFDLDKTEKRLHILVGLIKALEHLDEIIELIKKSPSPADARGALMERFQFTHIQAQNILDMKLQRLTALEQDKIREEHQQLLKLKAELQAILDSEERVLGIIKDELLTIKEKYGDRRRTKIVEKSTEINYEDLIAEEDMVVVVTHAGYIKRTALSQYRIQRRKGHGVRGMTTKEEDFVEHLFISFTHDHIMFFSDIGRVYWLKVHELPLAGRQAKGNAIVNLLRLGPQEKITALLPVKEFVPNRFVTMATLKGVIKKTSLDAFSNPRSGGVIAISLDEGDKLISAKVTSGDQALFIGTKHGQAIRFHESQVRSMGRPARGVRGISLRYGDEVVGMEVLDKGATILTVTEKGYGKRTKVRAYPEKNRGGLGVKNIKITSKNGRVVGIIQVFESESIMLSTAEGTFIWMGVKDISVLGRATMGVKLQNLEESDKVVAVAKQVESED
jgi:DNA gyrase subunit A